MLSRDQLFAHCFAYEAQTTFRFAVNGDPKEHSVNTLFTRIHGIVCAHISTVPTYVGEQMITEGFVTFAEPLTFKEAYSYFTSLCALSRFLSPLTPNLHKSILGTNAKVLAGVPDDLGHLPPLKKRKVAFSPRTVTTAAPVPDPVLSADDLEIKYPGIRQACARHIQKVNKAKASKK